MLIDFVLELVTHLLGITQKHLCVVFVEHWVVGTSIAGTHGALHHNDCLALPHLQMPRFKLCSSPSWQGCMQCQHNNENKDHTFLQMLGVCRACHTVCKHAQQ